MQHYFNSICVFIGKINVHFKRFENGTVVTIEVLIPE